MTKHITTTTHTIEATYEIGGDINTGWRMPLDFEADNLADIETELIDWFNEGPGSHGDFEVTSRDIDWEYGSACIEGTVTGEFFGNDNGEDGYDDPVKLRIVIEVEEK